MLMKFLTALFTTVLCFLLTSTTHTAGTRGHNSRSKMLTVTAAPTATPTPSETMKLPGSLTQDHSETDFVNVDNLKACDDGTTNVTLVANSDSSIISGSSMSFSPTVPVGATIRGVIFHLENYNDQLASGVPTINLGWALHLNGTNLGSYRFADVPIDDGGNQYDDGDGTSTLGFTLTAATVRDSTFGFKFKVANTDPKLTMEIAISCVQVSIFWTP